VAVSGTECPHVKHSNVTDASTRSNQKSYDGRFDRDIAFFAAVCTQRVHTAAKKRGV
jgi:hypothetical protein